MALKTRRQCFSLLMHMLQRKDFWNLLTTCSLQVCFQKNPSLLTLHLSCTLANDAPCVGIVPALFPDDERESVLNQIRNEALQKGAAPSKESLWQYFVDKSANNLHIVLCMSPVGDTLRMRCKNFPGLIVILTLF